MKNKHIFSPILSPLSIIILVVQLVPTLLAYCYSPEVRGNSKIQDFMILPNNTVLTIDFNGGYRLYSDS